MLLYKEKTIVLAHSSGGSRPSRLSHKNGIMEGRGNERSHSETRSQRLRKGISVTTLFWELAKNSGVYAGASQEQYSQWPPNTISHLMLVYDLPSVPHCGQSPNTQTLGGCSQTIAVHGSKSWKAKCSLMVCLSHILALSNNHEKEGTYSSVLSLRGLF